ncbi:hypothetical protein T439DRAFT_326625 [Meredithblackwellia eburnea MCA 4105]
MPSCRSEHESTLKIEEEGPVVPAASCEKDPGVDVDSRDCDMVGIQEVETLIADLKSEANKWKARALDAEVGLAMLEGKLEQYEGSKSTCKCGVKEDLSSVGSSNSAVCSDGTGGMKDHTSCVNNAGCDEMELMKEGDLDDWEGGDWLEIGADGE